MTGQMKVRETGFPSASLSNTNWSRGSSVEGKAGGSPVIIATSLKWSLRLADTSHSGMPPVVYRR